MLQNLANILYKIVINYYSQIAFLGHNHQLKYQMSQAALIVKQLDELSTLISTILHDLHIFVASVKRTVFVKKDVIPLYKKLLISMKQIENKASEARQNIRRLIYFPTFNLVANKIKHHYRWFVNTNFFQYDSEYRDHNYDSLVNGLTIIEDWLKKIKNWDFDLYLEFENAYMTAFGCYYLMKKNLRKSTIKSLSDNTIESFYQITQSDRMALRKVISRCQ